MKFAAVFFLAAIAAASAATLELFAGGGTKVADAPATECALREPFGVEFLPDGSALIPEMVTGNRILRVDAGGRLTVFAGTGVKGFSGDGGAAVAAQFNGIHNLAVAKNGDVFVGDSWNYRVRKIDGKSGVITTFAGTGKKAFSGDGGPAGAAEFSTIIQIALDPAGANLFVADIENKRIRRIALDSGVVTTVAGTGKGGVPADGADAKHSPLADPRAVVAAADGSFYILERGGHALRHVDAAGVIRTVAGTGAAALGGDGVALAIGLNGPKHACLDRDGSVIIADAENHVIRRYIPATGQMVRVAGTGKKGAGAPGGEALATALNRPHGVTIAADGSLFITDSYNNRVLRLRGK